MSDSMTSADKKRVEETKAKVFIRYRSVCFAVTGNDGHQEFTLAYKGNATERRWMAKQLRVAFRRLLGVRVKGGRRGKKA